MSTFQTAGTGISEFQPTVPSSTQTLGVLIWAEALAFTRTWRTILWTAGVPALILFLAGRQVTGKGAGPVLTVCAVAIVIGIFSLGLMGYGTVLAGYRERGIFQLLRCTPAPASQLLVARLLVQLLAVLVQGVIVLAAARLLYGVSPSLTGVALMLPLMLLTGLASLSLGQVVAALTRHSATTTAVSRLLLIALFVLEGFLGGKGWPREVQMLADLSPVQLSQNLLSSSMITGQLTAAGWEGLGALLVWIIVMGFVGLRWFQWEHE